MSSAYLCFLFNRVLPLTSMHLPSALVPLRFHPRRNSARRTWHVGQTSSRRIPPRHTRSALSSPRAPSLFPSVRSCLLRARILFRHPSHRPALFRLSHLPFPSPSFLSLHSSAPHLFRVLSCFLRSPPMDILLPIRVPSFFIFFFFYLSCCGGSCRN
ncbi:hypothetical protein C8R44DRAFT_810535 [Mycena epipterygia]|nr:hypothetical protein C8R44DRAFT_810535 [Mycena epipterygia]